MKQTRENLNTKASGTRAEKRQPGLAWAETQTAVTALTPSVDVLHNSP